MGYVTLTKCDHCGKRVERPCDERGWIQLDSSSHPLSVTRMTGKMSPDGGFAVDLLENVIDFCGLACLAAALDRKAREREDKENKGAKKIEERSS
jgi:hypothetical protein